MKKVIYRSISIIFLIAAITAVVGFFTVKGSGIIDLSNILRLILAGIAVGCVLLSSVTWVTEDPVKKRMKWIFLIAAILAIVILLFLAASIRPGAVEMIN